MSSNLNESVLKSVYKTLNESLEMIDYETYRNFISEVCESLSDVCEKYRDFDLSPEDIKSALDEFQYRFFRDLNESKERKLTESYDLYILTDDREEKKIKSFKKAAAVKKAVNDLVTNPSKLEDMGATEMFVLDGEKESDNELYVFALEEDGWNTIYDNLPSDKGFEYRDNPLNRIYYSLTGNLPENFTYHAEDGLRKGIIRTKKGNYVQDGEEAGILFDDNGNAHIRITLNTELSDKKETRKWIEEVAKHFNVEAKPFGKKSYEIVVKDQARYFEEE